MKAAALLPEPEQNEVAEGILAYVDLLNSGHPRLTAAQQLGVQRAQHEAQEGLFATDAQMATIWKKFGA